MLLSLKKPCWGPCRLVALALEVQLNRTAKKRKRQDGWTAAQAAAGAAPEAQQGVATAADTQTATAADASMQASATAAAISPGPAAAADTDVECGSAEAVAAHEAGCGPACTPVFSVMPPAPEMQQIAEDASSGRRSGDSRDAGAADVDDETLGDEDEATGDQVPVRASL